MGVDHQGAAGPGRAAFRKNGGRRAIRFQQAHGKAARAQQTGDVFRIAPDIGRVAGHVGNAQQFREAVDDFLLVGLAPGFRLLGHRGCISGAGCRREQRQRQDGAQHEQTGGRMRGAVVSHCWVAAGRANAPTIGAAGASRK
jgi:hypothetical protein